MRPALQFTEAWMTRFVGSKKSFSGCCLATTIFLFALFAPNTAQADPLTLSGVVTMDRLNFTAATVTAHLISSEFDVMLTANSENWPGICDPCVTGTHFSTAAFFPDPPTGSGSGTIQGVTYPRFELVNGSFLFAGPSVPVPPATPGETFALTLPFTVSGAFEPSLTTGVNALPFYNAPVVGNGLATLTFSAGPDLPDIGPSWVITRAVYQFGNASTSPTPEPITFALFGSGLALAFAKYRRRRENER
jgi:hypothetical protein